MFADAMNRPALPALQALQPARLGAFVVLTRNRAHSAGVEVIATRSDATTAMMKARASGPTKRPCTLEVNNSGRKTTTTTAVA